MARGDARPPTLIADGDVQRSRRTSAPEQSGSNRQRNHRSRGPGGSSRWRRGEALADRIWSDCRAGCASRPGSWTPHAATDGLGSWLWGRAALPTDICSPAPHQTRGRSETPRSHYHGRCARLSLRDARGHGLQELIRSRPWASPPVSLPRRPFRPRTWSRIRETEMVGSR
jgi:hypothetical protein